MATAIDPRVIPRAPRLRRDMTSGEQKLWAELRQFRRWYGIHVRKQAPIGVYVVDFVMHERRLVIEVDGQHHCEPERIRRDHEREGWLAGEGYKVLRFNTGELSENLEGCIEEILRALGMMDNPLRSPNPNPSPQGGRGPGRR